MIYTNRKELPPAFSVSTLAAHPLLSSVLMCRPDYFDVIDVKNAFMSAQVGQVDRAKAQAQWSELKTTFERLGVPVREIPPTPGLEDMVFCANQTFLGLDPSNARLCLLGQMRFPSRQKEVPAFEKWFREMGYRVESLHLTGARFEGGGDALWHPGRRLVWGGVGPRTQREAYNVLADRFQVPVCVLELATADFYHLDTCFAAMDEKTVLLHGAALSPASRDLVYAVYSDVIEVSREEAISNMACNAVGLPGRNVVLQRGSTQTVAALRARGFNVVEVETGEFMKSGGSVFCMKMGLY